MKFGPASPADAIGGVTVHTLRQGSLVLKKGTTIGLAEVEALNKAGVKEVVVVRLEQGDVSEDVAAASIAEAVAGDSVNVERAFTGRSNLFAAQAGVLVVDRAAVDRINGVDEAITFATLAAFKPVVEGEMIATVKLIPFGVEAKLRDTAVAVAGQGALRIAPYVIKRVGVVSTLLPGLATKVIDKTLRVTAERLAPAGATIIAERRVPHEEAALASSIKELLGLGAELVIVFGASANALTWWDNRHAAVLGFEPRDSSEQFRAKVEAVPPPAAGDPVAVLQGGVFTQAGPFEPVEGNGSAN